MMIPSLFDDTVLLIVDVKKDCKIIWVMKIKISVLRNLDLDL